MNINLGLDNVEASSSASLTQACLKKYSISRTEMQCLQVNLQLYPIIMMF